MKNIFFVFVMLLGVNTLFAEDETYSGLYVYGKDVHTFQPCGGQTYWVDGTDLVLSGLKKFYKEEAKASQPIYVMVRGHQHFEESKAPVSNYDGIFHISEVFLFSSVIPDSCQKEERNTTK